MFLRILIFLIITIPSICQADQLWKNFLWLAADGSVTVHNRYAKSLGYNYVGYRTFGTPAQYQNDPNTQDMYIYECTPHARAIRSLCPAGVSIIQYGSWAGYSQASKDWYLDNIGWGTTTAAPYCFTGNELSATKIDLFPDYQQQRVINLMVTQIMQEFGSMTYSPKNTQFAGYIVDECRLSGAFWKWNGSDQETYNLSDADRTGTDSTLIHALSTGGTITHEYTSIQDGIAAFYKTLNGSMTAIYPNSKWILTPYLPYNTSQYSEEWIYTISQRSDKALLTPDMLFQENTGTQFVDDNNIFASGVSITRNMVGSQQVIRGAEDINRTQAIACGTSTAWFHWSQVISDGTGMPSYDDVINYPPRLKLIRCIPNWDNLILVDANGNLLSTSTTRFIGNDNGTGSYYSVDTNEGSRTNSYISNKIYWGRDHRKPDRTIYACFLENSNMGTVTIPASDGIVRVWSVNNYFEKNLDVTHQFTLINNVLQPISTFSVDTGSGTGIIIETGTKGRMYSEY